MKIKSSDWDALISEMKIGDLEPDEMTAEMFAKEVGISIGGATNKLRELYRLNKTTRRWVKGRGGKMYAYKLVI